MGGGGGEGIFQLSHISRDGVEVGWEGGGGGHNSTVSTGPRVCVCVYSCDVLGVGYITRSFI